MFDEQVVRRDSRAADFMDQFICVRIVQANGMDLSLFQFDFDLTFAAFFMNADKTIYGRFGSRSDRKEAAKDITLEGFRKALAGALDLHKGYPGNSALFLRKRGPAPNFKVPEDYPSLKERYTSTLNYSGKVAQSCIHCHMAREAERILFRRDGKPMPEPVLYPWPMPNVVGLGLDPKEKAKVTSLIEGSPAERAGFKPGDEIIQLEGQPILSIADVQWVLHNAPQPAKLNAQVLRDHKKADLILTLDESWRQKTDLSWRASTWDLRRIASGGLVLEDLSEADRRKEKLRDDGLALRVQYVGQYGEHATGKQAGFQKDDLIVNLDGQSQRMSESRALGYLVQKEMPGRRILVTVLRKGEPIKLELPMQ